MLARQEGFDLPSAEEKRSITILRVEDAMHSGPAPVLKGETRVGEALKFLDAGQLSACLVRSEEHWALVTRAALAHAPQDLPLENAHVLEPAPRLYPDQTVDAALRLLGTHPLLPIASRADPDELVGTLTLADVRRAYGIGVPQAATPNGT
jgi:CBS domain-containing protein